MKYVTLFLALILSGITFAQLNYTKKYKWYENQLMKIGETEDHSIFVTSKFVGPFGEELTYFTLSADNAEPTLYEKAKLKVGKFSLRLVSSAKVGNELIEIYSGHKYGAVVTFSQTYIAKRNCSNFELIGAPKQIDTNFPTQYLSAYNGSPFLDMYADDEGVFVVSNSSEPKKNIKPYMKRFDRDLNEVLSQDLSSIYKDESTIRKVIHDKENKVLIYELNLAKCKDCGKLFTRTKVVNSAVPALMIIQPNKDPLVFQIELPEGMVYSYSKFFFNPSEETMDGIFEIHKMGASEYKGATGSGYFWGKWDANSGELLSSKQHHYDYSDILDGISGAEKVIFSSIGSVNQNQKYPKITGSSYRKKLSNGDFIIYYTNITPANPKAETENIQKTLNKNQLLVNLSSEGEIQWIRLISNHSFDKLRQNYFTKDDQLIHLSEGYSKNYPNGTYDFQKTTGTVYDRFTYHVIDLKSGETIQRKAFEERKSTREHTRGITHYNETAGRVFFGLQSNSGGASRAAEMAVFSID